MTLQHYGPARPFEALRELGASISKVETSSTMTIQGMPLASASKAGERFEVELPTSCGMQVVFGKESILKKLTKLFTNELQTGDQAFDDKVYIIARDDDKASAFLKSEDVRALIVEFVGEDETVAIDERRVTIHAVNAGLAAILSKRMWRA